MKREDWQAAFGQPSASFDARIQQTLNHLEVKKMKKFTVRTFALVLALMLALMGVAYAVTNGGKIVDYFEMRWTDERVNVPKGFESGFDQTLTQQIGDVVYTIRDAYVDGNNLQAVVTVARADGKPALFLGAMFEPEDQVDNLFLDGREDLRTCEEYARDKDMPLYQVNSSFHQEGGTGDAMMDIWVEDDLTTALFESVADVKVENGAAKLEWRVSLWQGEEVERASMTIEIPAEEAKEWDVPVNQTVEGLPMTLDTVYLKETRMGLHVDIAYHYDPEKATEKEKKSFNNGIWLRLLDPATGKEIPGGASTGGGIRDLNEEKTAFLQNGDTISADFTGDTILLQAYDPWEKITYGTVAVKFR